jgi:type IV secretion system protein VirB4
MIPTRRILENEIAGASYLPRLMHHVNETLVTDVDGGVIFTCQLSGVAETARSGPDLEGVYDAIDRLFVTMGKVYSNRVSVWAHFAHLTEPFKFSPKFTHKWQDQFCNTYVKQFEQTPVFVNRFYLTVHLKPGLYTELRAIVTEAGDMQTMIKESLTSHNVRPLATYQGLWGGQTYSELYEFFGWLYNGRWERIAVGCPLSQSIPQATHYFDNVIETQHQDGGVRYSALSDLKDYPEAITRGMVSHLLSMPVEFLMTMSFCFVASQKMVLGIQQQLNKLQSANDYATEQIAELDDAMGGIAAGTAVFGELHCSVAVFADTPKKALEDRTTLNNALSARSNILMVPATASAPQTFFAQIPTGYKYRVRTQKKTTRVLAALFGLHSPLEGKSEGNALGDGSAVMPMRGDDGGVFFFNLHPSPQHTASVSKLISGHTLILGTTGEGKTTLQTVILTFASRFQVHFFALDKDQSVRGFIESNNGQYYTLKAGIPTGLNPFQLPDTPSNREMQYLLVTACARLTGIDTTEDVSDIKAAVDTLYAYPVDQRRFASLVQAIPDKGPNCVKRRLQQFVYGEQTGRYAYALDNETNQFSTEQIGTIGFDVSDFLVPDNPVTEPMLIYLLHLKKMMVDSIQLTNGYVATIIEEFWVALGYPTTQAMVMDILKTGRKRKEVVVLVTQSPADALRSDATPAIIEQTATKIFLPNPDAEFSNDEGTGYSRVGLTKAEFDVLHTLTSGSRRFLLKQRGECAVLKLDMKGLEPYIKLLAGSADDLAGIEKSKASKGAEPDEWVTDFIERANNGK